MSRFKTFPLILLLIVVFGFQLWSQDFKAGAQFGIAATQVTGDQLSGYNKVGPMMGIFVNHDLGNFTFFQLEMNYIQKGSRKNAQPDKGIYDSYLLRLNYIEMPVIFGYRFNSKFQMLLAIQGAYLINYRQKDSYGFFDPDPTVPGFKKFELSGMAGLNFQFADNAWVSFRFSYSILPLRPRPDNPTAYYDQGQFNDVLSTSLQYRF